MAIDQERTAKPVSSRKASSSISLAQFKAEIEKRANEIYLKRQLSNIAGNALSDWLLAEEEIKKKHNIV